jgi:hypothetical protein
MMRLILVVVCVSLGFGTLAKSARANANAKAQWSPEKIAEYLSNKSIETAQFAKKTKAKDVFESLKRIIRNDEVGFEIVLEPGDRDDRYDSQVELPEIPKKMSMNTAIKLVVSQLPDNIRVSYRKGSIVVSSRPMPPNGNTITIEGFSINGSLEQALSDLSERVGVNIVIDERVREKTQKNIKAKFVNQVSLESVLFVLTNMSDLAFVHVEDNLYYITNPSNANECKKVFNRRIPAP